MSHSAAGCTSRLDTVEDSFGRDALGAISQIFLMAWDDFFPEPAFDGSITLEQRLYAVAHNVAYDA
jgi:hypothetical protein